MTHGCLHSQADVPEGRSNQVYIRNRKEEPVEQHHLLREVRERERGGEWELGCLYGYVMQVLNS